MTDGHKFFKGVFVPLKGATLVLSSFKFMLYAAIPFWLSLVLGIYTLIKLWTSGGIVINELYGKFPVVKTIADYTKIAEYSLAEGFFQIFFWLVLIILIAYFSYLLLTILGAPFYALLSEGILRQQGAKPFSALGFNHWLKVTMKMFLINCTKMILFLIIATALLVLSFVPGLVLIVPLVACLMISFDCMDFSFECMTFSFKDRISFFQKHLVAFFGLSLTIFAIGVIPGLFTLTLPFFIAGGAELFARLNEDIS